MAANPRGEEASTSTRPGWRSRMRSRSTLNLARPNDRYFVELRPKFSRRLTLERFRDCGDVLGSVSATAAGNIDQAAICKLRQIVRHVLGSEIEACLRQRIRQPSIGISRDRHICLFREFPQKWIHEIGTKRAVESHR